MRDSEPTQDFHPRKVGERIAEARMAAGVHLDDIAQRTRVPLRHLQAIESGRYDQLPATTYSAGFVKMFARSVGLDGEQAAADFRAERGDHHGNQVEYTTFEPADPARVPPRLLAAAGIATAILLAIVYIVWRSAGTNDDVERLASSGPAETVQTAAPPTAPAAPQPQQGAAASAADQVVLTAADDVWLKVSEKNGPTIFMGQLAPGESYSVPLTATDPRLLTGRPQALRATIGKQQVPAIGSSELTIRDVPLKGDLFAAWVAAEIAGAAPAAPPAPAAGATPVAGPGVIAPGAPAE